MFVLKLTSQVEQGTPFRSKYNKQNTVSKPTGLQWKDEGPPFACLWKERTEAKTLFTIVESLQPYSDVCASIQFSLLQDAENAQGLCRKVFTAGLPALFLVLIQQKSTHQESAYRLVLSQE